MLTACPRCDYSLRGLPADHACRECGLGYDEASETFQHTRQRTLRRHAANDRGRQFDSAPLGAVTPLRRRRRSDRTRGAE